MWGELRRAVGAVGSAPGSSDDNEEVWELWGSVWSFMPEAVQKG